MTKIKSIIVVLILALVAGGAALYGVNTFLRDHALSIAESRIPGAASSILDQLRVEAYQRIQNLWQENRNTNLIASLSKAPTLATIADENVASTLAPIHDELFQLLEPMQKKLKVAKLMIISNEGRELAQAPDKGKFGNSWRGIPAVKDCLLGVSRDGMYELQGKISQLVAVPLVDEKGKTSGCLVSADAFDAESLTLKIKPQGLGFALVMRKTVLASSLDASLLQPLLEKIDSEQPIWFGSAAGETPLFAGVDGKAFVASSFALPSATDPLRLAIILPVAPLLSPAKKLQNHLFLGTALLLVLGIILAWLLSSQKSGDRQANRLASDLSRLNREQGRYQLDPSDYTGVYADIARALIQKEDKHSPQKSESLPDLLGKTAASSGIGESSSASGAKSAPPLDFDSLLGGSSDLGDMRQGPSTSTSPPAAAFTPATTSPSPSPSRTPSPFSPPPISSPAQNFSAPGPKVDVPGDLAGIFSEIEENKISPEFQLASAPPSSPGLPQAPIAKPSPMASPSMPPVAKPSYLPPGMPITSQPPSELFGQSNDVSTSLDEFRPEATVVAQVPDALLRAASNVNDGLDASMDAAFSEALSSKPPSSAPDSEESHFKEVFDQFLKTKRQCNESTAGLTLDKFSEKLKKNAADLKSRYKCSSVRFQVYVKNGKAALKATPSK